MPRLQPLWPGLWLLAFSFLCIAPGCRPAPRSAFGVDQWQGRTIDGAALKLADLETPAVVLNIYSPTCAPCIEELPALNALYRQAKARGAAMFLAVELDPEEFQIAVPADASEEAIFRLVADRILQDVRRFGIEPPVLILAPPFRIDPARTLITGTPETLFFRTNPLRLDYNFIGPISSAQTEPMINADSRYQFALRALDRVLAASGDAGAALDYSTPGM